MKLLKGWRTIAFNFAVASISVIDLVLNDGSILSTVFANPARAAAAVVALKAANIVLRVLTTTPLGQKD